MIRDPFIVFKRKYSNLPAGYFGFAQGLFFTIWGTSYNPGDPDDPVYYSVAQIESYINDIKSMIEAGTFDPLDPSFPNDLSDFMQYGSDMKSYAISPGAGNFLYSDTDQNLALRSPADFKYATLYYYEICLDDSGDTPKFIFDWDKSNITYETYLTTFRYKNRYDNTITNMTGRLDVYAALKYIDNSKWEFYTGLKHPNGTKSNVVKIDPSNISYVPVDIAYYFMISGIWQEFLNIGGTTAAIPNDTEFYLSAVYDGVEICNGFLYSWWNG